MRIIGIECASDDLAVTNLFSAMIVRVTSAIMNCICSAKVDNTKRMHL